MLKFIHSVYLLSTFISPFCTCQQYSVKYSQFDYPNHENSNYTILTGIREIQNNNSNVYITAITLFQNAFMSNLSSIGLLYSGSINGGGVWRSYQYPSSLGINVTATYFYGPDGNDTHIQVVGSYSTKQVSENEYGFLYQGSLDGTNAQWLTLNPQVLETEEFVFQTVGHSIHGNIAVGGFYTVKIQARAFIYDVLNEWYDELRYDGAKSITAYSILYHEGSEYSIAGAFQDQNDVSLAYVCTWDSVSRTASQWTTYAHTSGDYWTHFEGMSHGGSNHSTSSQYTFSADWIKDKGLGDLGTSFVIVDNITDQNSKTTWIDFKYPGSLNSSANSVLGNYVIGTFTTREASNIAHGFVAEFMQLNNDSDSSNSSELSIGIIIAIVIPAFFVFIGVLVLVYWYCLKGSSDTNGKSNETGVRMSEGKSNLSAKLLRQDGKV